MKFEFTKTAELMIKTALGSKFMLRVADKARMQAAAKHSEVNKIRGFMRELDAPVTKQQKYHLSKLDKLRSKADDVRIKRSRQYAKFTESANFKKMLESL